MPGGLEAGLIAEIVTTDLVVRSLPEISDASLVDRSSVPMGFLAYIVDGPVAADGYDWYQVAPFPPTMSDVVEEHPRFGWLAAGGTDGEPWIAPWDGECPGPGWDGLMLSQRYVMLACWAGVDLTLEGTLRSCDSQGGTVGQPAWIYRVSCHLVGPDYGDLLAAGLALHFAPGVSTALGDGARVRVIGHLGDPGADECSEEPLPGTGTPPDLVRLQCRRAFVVTEIIERED